MRKKQVRERREHEALERQNNQEVKRKTDFALQSISSTTCQQTNRETDLPIINLPTGQLTNRYMQSISSTTCQQTNRFMEYQLITASLPADKHTNRFTLYQLPQLPIDVSAHPTAQLTNRQTDLQSLNSPTCKQTSRQ